MKCAVLATKNFCYFETTRMIKTKRRMNLSSRSRVVGVVGVAEVVGVKNILGVVGVIGVAGVG